MRLRSKLQVSVSTTDSVLANLADPSWLSECLEEARIGQVSNHSQAHISSPSPCSLDSVLQSSSPAWWLRSNGCSFVVRWCMEVVWEFRLFWTAYQRSSGLDSSGLYNFMKVTTKSWPGGASALFNTVAPVLWRLIGYCLQRMACLYLVSIQCILRLNSIWSST